MENIYLRNESNESRIIFSKAYMEWDRVESPPAGH